MALRFAYRTPDGLAIVIAAPKESLAPLLGRLNEETGLFEWSDEDYRAHVIERSIPPDASEVTELPDDWQPPEDRTFRNAWSLRMREARGDRSRASGVARRDRPPGDRGGSNA